MTDVVVLALILAAAAAGAWWWRRRDGSVRAGRPGERLSAPDRAAVGAPDGTVVLLEFTAPGCRPCVATKRVLDDIAATRSDVVVATADVGAHVRLARTHGVLRAPTTLVIDRAGVVRHRVSGVPAVDDLGTAVDEDACAGR